MGSLGRWRSLGILALLPLGGVSPLAAQTAALVKNINRVDSPSAGSMPQQLVDVGGILFFSATEGMMEVNEELWRSDGTRAGTFKVKDINPLGQSYPTNLTNA